MRRLLVVLAAFVGALGLAYGLGRGVQAIQGEEVPVVCPAGPLPERLAGHIVGLAHVVSERYGAKLGGVVPGSRTGGPEPLATMTVIQGSRLTRTGRFDRRLHGEFDEGAGYALEIPASVLPGPEDVVFVTSACVPDHPVALRVWQNAPKSGGPHGLAVRGALGGWLRAAVGDEVIAETRPRLLATMTTTIPGCGRIEVVGSDTSAPDVDTLAGLACVDEAGAAATALVPELGTQLEAVATLDLDGDGVDEVIAVQMFALHGGRTARRGVLLAWDAAGGGFTAVDLGPVLEA